MSGEGKISYAAVCRAVAGERHADAAKAATWVKGTYKDAPDWPAIAAEWERHATVLDGLAALVERAEETIAQYTGPMSQMSHDALNMACRDLCSLVAAGFSTTPATEDGR